MNEPGFFEQIFLHRSAQDAACFPKLDLDKLQEEETKRQKNIQ
jgi:hypothetical protein